MSWTAARMVRSSALLVLCCLIIKCSSYSNIDHCDNHQFTCCSFHSTCIESTLNCGLYYAQQRCEELDLLQHSNSGCQRCVQNQPILDWVLASENCFQSELLRLVRNQTKKYPDPPDCLNFEYDALHVLEQCYSDTNPICQLMDSVGLDVLESDLKVVLNAVTVDSYHESIVKEQFGDLINSCKHPQAPSLASSVAPDTRRMLLCAAFLVDNQLRQEGLTLALAEKLNQSSTDFEVASYDPKLVYKCQKKSNPKWFVGSTDYYLVHWTLSAGANMAALTLCQQAGACVIDMQSPLVYFAYTSPTTSSCGNGLRDAGEWCDLFVYTGQMEYGCDQQCRAIPGYECTTERLLESLCSKTVCGDGVRTSDEECDVGAATSIGCNPETCTIQEGYRCETSYNTTSHCIQI